MSEKCAILLQFVRSILLRCIVGSWAVFVMGIVVPHPTRAGDDLWTGFPDGFPILRAGDGTNTWINIGASGTPLAGNGDWYYDSTTRFVHIRFIIKFGNYDQTYVASQPLFGLKIFDDNVSGLPPKPMLDVIDSTFSLSGAGFNVAHGSVVAQKGLTNWDFIHPLGHAQLLAGFTVSGNIPYVVFVHDVVPPAVTTLGNPIPLSYVNSVSPWEWISADDGYMIKGTFSYLAEPE